MCDKEPVCRTCLRAENLSPIFSRSEHHGRYTVALFLTTGLQIELDDGLPQTICAECINIINMAIEFRNQSHESEKNLLHRRHSRISKTRGQNKQRKRTIANLDIQDVELSQCVEYDISEIIPEIKAENQMYSEDINEFDDTIFSNKRNRTEAFEKSKDINYNESVPQKFETNRQKGDKNKRYKHLVDGPMGGPGPYECKICKKILKSWSSFRTHAKIHLGFDFMCEYCGKTFIAVTMLQRHCMSQHGAERTYCCKLCDHRALDSEHLKIHERREHTGDRPYVCDACGASFLTRRYLVHHLAVHMTQRTVQCEKCPAKFKSTQHLACHTSKVHRPRGWRMKCYLCDNTYTKYENVRKHIAKIHGVPRQHQATIRRVRVAAEA